MRLAMMIDLDKCVGCQACVTACKERWDSGPAANRDWVYTYEGGDRKTGPQLTFYPGLCMQCADHPCTTDCPTGATYMDRDGIVVVDPNVCIGCGNCLTMCAYNARRTDPVKGIVEKCNLCQPYLRRGQQPACVTTCLAECRHFGDLDDLDSDLVERINQRHAQPLETPEVQIGAKVTYAGIRHRQAILARNVVTPPRRSILTTTWSGVTRPLTFIGLPAFMLAVIGGGAAINFYRQRILAPHPLPATPQHETTDNTPTTLKRHRAAIRILHWSNLLTWLVLLISGLGMLSTSSFTFFGPSFSAEVAGLFGGAGNLLYFHAAWGVLWIILTVPAFLLFKGWGLEAVKEIALTRDDLTWLVAKPFQLLGLTRQPLPPQDKYNAGQKLYAMLVLVASAIIMMTGCIMTFHLGPAWLVALSILLHKIAIVSVLAGLAVHVTMAVLMKEERAALAAMLSGRLDAEHAAHHYQRWYQEKSGKSEAIDHE